jgi:serine phosphatase RsbU (regulator of sigma subunit)
MGFFATLKNKLVGRALEKCADPFEEGRITVLLNFSLFMFITNLPYTFITFSHDPSSPNFISAIVQDVSTAAVIIILNRGYNLKLARNIFFANFFVQNVYHFLVNNGTSGILAQGVLFFLMNVMFAFFLYGARMGWITFLLMSAMVLTGFYNERTDFSLFRFPESLVDPMAADDLSFLIILPIAMNVYLISEFVKAQNKAKRRIYQQNQLLFEKNREITDSINYAQKIQQAILPSHATFTSAFHSFFILYKPKDIVAGDFYFLETTNDQVVCAVADCTGHGVPGAMMSVAGANSLKRSVKEFGLSDAGKILDKTKELIIDNFSHTENGIKDGMDISLIALDRRKNRITWSGANNPLVILRNGELIEYKGDKQPIGHHVHSRPFTTHEIDLQPGDKLYMFTDGFQDQFGGPKQKKYSTKRLRQQILRTSDSVLNEQQQLLEMELVAWKKELDQVDDICVIGIQVV